ncbi:MAG: helix-turn-helix domain-containing protein [Halovenus sp.]
MASNSENEGAEVLSPDAAFSALGNETRIRILRTLGQADGPLSFTDLRTRVGIRHGGQFTYHLDKLVGHFVSKTDGKYDLRQAGRRVVEAVLSGAVTSDPVLEPTPIDEPCPRCGAGTVVAFSQERVEHYCPECAGHYGPARATSEHATAGTSSDEDAPYGYLGSVPLPPAGVQDRTPEEVFQASSTWGVLELLAVASGVCPRCSASLTESLSICEDHDATESLCDQCENRHAIMITRRCPNCLYEQGGAFVLALMANIHLLRFLIANGLNPVSPSAPTAHDAALMNYDEDLLSVDPFEARFTFSIDENSLTLTVDDDLQVVEVTRC